MSLTLSIIIPVYNAEATLARCVDSLLLQPLPSCEVVLVDDGSTDGSGPLCDRLAARDGRIRVLHQKNGGASAARNAGLNAARGEILHFVDADDTVDAGLYADLVPQMQADGPDALLFACHSPGSTEPLDRLPDITVERLSELDKEFLAQSILSTGIFSAPYNKLFRASALKKSGVRFDERLRVNEDFRFNLQFFAVAGRLRFTSRARYCYYTGNEASLSGGFRTDLWESARYNRDVVSAFAAAAGLDPAETVCRYENACAVRQFYLLVGRAGPADARRRALGELMRDSRARGAILDALRADPNRLPAALLRILVWLRAAGPLAALLCAKHPG